MFKKLFLTFILSAAAYGATAQSAITFKAVEHNFGVIDDKGGKSSYDFTFTNTGDCPLVITRATASCKCVDIEYSKRPIPVGGHGKITVSYNPKKQKGVFYKAIQIYANTAERRHTVLIRGEVD
jgi:hypothetical protein